MNAYKLESENENKYVFTANTSDAYFSRIVVEKSQDGQLNEFAKIFLSNTNAQFKDDNKVSVDAYFKKQSPTEFLFKAEDGTDPESREAGAVDFDEYEHIYLKPLASKWETECSATISNAAIGIKPTGERAGELKYWTEHIRLSGEEYKSLQAVENQSAENSSQHIKQDKSLMSDLADVLESGEVITRTNPALDGEVRVKRGGMNEGLVHLIDHRMRERVLNKNVQMDEGQAQKETSAILFLAIDNIDKVPAEKEANGHYAVYNKGIKTVIGKDKNGRYVVTGYDNKQTEKEAAESINAVIAQYGSTPEFLGIYAQVGAVIASNSILSQAQEKANQNPLTAPTKIEVNGKVRECKDGIMAGFKNAVQLVDKLIDVNQELADENDRLRSQLQARNKSKGISR